MFRTRITVFIIIIFLTAAIPGIAVYPETGNLGTIRIGPVDTHRVIITDMYEVAMVCVVMVITS